GSGTLGIANFPQGLFFLNGQAEAFNFFGVLYTINTTTGAGTATSVTISGGFGPVQGAAAAPAVGAVPGPSSAVLAIIGVLGPWGVLLLRRRTKAARPA